MSTPCITLQYISLQHLRSHYLPVRQTTTQYNTNTTQHNTDTHIMLQCLAFHCTILDYVTSDHIRLHNMSSHDMICSDVTWQYITHIPRTGRASSTLLGAGGPDAAEGQVDLAEEAARAARHERHVLETPRSARHWRRASPRWRNFACRMRSRQSPPLAPAENGVVMSTSRHSQPPSGERRKPRTARPHHPHGTPAPTTGAPRRNLTAITKSAASSTTPRRGWRTQSQPRGQLARGGPRRSTHLAPRLRPRARRGRPDRPAVSERVACRRRRRPRGARLVDEARAMRGARARTEANSRQRHALLHATPLLAAARDLSVNERQHSRSQASWPNSAIMTAVASSTRRASSPSVCRKTARAADILKATRTTAIPRTWRTNRGRDPMRSADTHQRATPTDRVKWENDCNMGVGVSTCEKGVNTHDVKDKLHTMLSNKPDKLCPAPQRCRCDVSEGGCAGPLPTVTIVEYGRNHLGSAAIVCKLRTTPNVRGLLSMRDVPHHF